MTQITEPVSDHRLRKQNLITAFTASFAFFILVNGYRFMSPLLSGDGLLMLYQNDAAWQIALGRFAHPFIVMLRGGLTSPFLISALALFWTAAAVYLVPSYLRIRGRLSLICLSAVMVCNPALTVTSANFLHEFDCYALALFLSVASVCLIAEFISQKRWLYAVGGVLCLALSCSIYQAYVCVAAGLVMIRLLLAAAGKGDLRQILKEAALTLGLAVAAAVLYVIAWKIMQSALGIWTADTYNGLSGMGDYSETGVLEVLGLTYRNVADYFFNPATFVTTTFRDFDISAVWGVLLLLCNLAVLLLTLLWLLRMNRENQTDTPKRLLQAALLILFPFGINLVCFVSKGMEHTLMIYAFALVYVLAIALWDAQHAEAVAADAERTADGSLCGTRGLRRFLLPAALALLTWAQIVSANQLYFKKDLQERAAQSLMTRILVRIEETPGYVPGETAVAFTGSFEVNPYIEPLQAFEDVIVWQTGKTSLVYFGTDYAYLSYFENMSVNMTRLERDREDIAQMPCYPLDGSVAFVDGVLVVKISD
ncbi:MAG: glucosyltransferase domain-containing protein [Lachnospiraceae bacterium]|nr:glucosyltransferase domain-containing protein [Lachnospiraceae bacterium]